MHCSMATIPMAKAYNLIWKSWVPGRARYKRFAACNHRYTVRIDENKDTRQIKRSRIIPWRVQYPTRGNWTLMEAIWDKAPQATRLKTSEVLCRQKPDTPTLLWHRLFPSQELMTPSSEKWSLKSQASEEGSPKSTPPFSLNFTNAQMLKNDNHSTHIFCPTLFTQFTRAPRANRLSTTSANTFPAADMSGVSPSYAITTGFMCNIIFQVKHASR